jgi:hypothetical protein
MNEDASRLWEQVQCLQGQVSRAGNSSLAAKYARTQAALDRLIEQQGGER